MRNNILHNIIFESAHLVVCETLTEGFENTPIEGCKQRKAEWYTTRELLKEVCPQAEISYGVNGEPLLSGSEEYSHLSISHGAGKVAILLSKNHCGVDIESATRNFSRVATRFLSDRERTFITPEDYPVAWSAKEAIFKFFQGKEVEFLSDFEITTIKDTELNIKHKDKSYVVSIINHQGYVLAYIF